MFLKLNSKELKIEDLKNKNYGAQNPKSSNNGKNRFTKKKTAW